jgi:hypothetical protein
MKWWFCDGSSLNINIQPDELTLDSEMNFYIAMVVLAAGQELFAGFHARARSYTAMDSNAMPKPRGVIITP